MKIRWHLRISSVGAISRSRCIRADVQCIGNSKIYHRNPQGKIRIDSIENEACIVPQVSHTRLAHGERVYGKALHSSHLFNRTARKN